ncbi:MAG TPA: aminoglycoside phosphotransferase family protein [Pyrinomonadaceae bacterium]|jgi:tRNA A-37 threonylcarbamoyl transferase component Bud32|nr:aminoglycoside phosphotransferase family protein [Pyrinomonadaceae bacterium]
MSSAASNDISSVPVPERLVDAVRRNLKLADTTPVYLKEVVDFTNINYIYRVEIPERSLYIKVVPERPKRFPVRLSPERVFSEAEGLRRFRSLVNGLLIIPEVLFVDREEMALGMSDVGEDRQVLFGVISQEFDLLGEQAKALGTALGRIHRGTRNAGSFRPPEEEAVLLKVIFDGLLGPGAQQVFPEAWDELKNEMLSHQECLIHGDLWTKNLLVRKGTPVALVDFEGVCYGDPAFDLGTLIAVALLPALDMQVPISEALSFTSEMLSNWSTSCGSEAWAREVLPRAFRATACFLATRGFGPFAYQLSDRGREQLKQLCHALVNEPPSELDAFHAFVKHHVDSTSLVPNEAS